MKALRKEREAAVAEKRRSQSSLYDSEIENGKKNKRKTMKWSNDNDRIFVPNMKNYKGEGEMKRGER